MTLEEAMKMIFDHRAKVKRTKDDWHDGYYDGLTAALLMLSEDKPADTGKPVWKAKDKLTLTELAHELRELFDFKYLTVDSCGEGIMLWLHKPEPVAGDWLAGDSDHILAFFANSLNMSLDLSEYKDENGVLDYSHCIVEVSDDID